MIEFENIYKNKRVLLTGHTGFKGSWLALWLSELGAEVTGVALPPESHPNHWDLLKLPMESHFLDIRNYDENEKVIKKSEPEIIFHLAAQPLVRRSYNDPISTWSTNVMGTVNILNACRYVPSVKAIVVVTTDKCYENRDWIWGYRESDVLGGHDPYSASKASAEFVVKSFRSSFFNHDNSPLLATARAGNVIGGGDWSEDRLIPDLVRAIEQDQILKIRSPLATRPWQHVLESLSGYLKLGAKLLNGERAFADAWNFGPKEDANCTVSDILEKIRNHWHKVEWKVIGNQGKHEAKLLSLDSSKAKYELLWKPIWNLEMTLAKTAEWYKLFYENKKIISREQLVDYLQDANQDDHITTAL